VDEPHPSDETLFAALAEAVRASEPGAPLLGVRSVPGHVIERELSSGGQGAVYEARELATGRLVALKVLARRDEASRARFAREVTLAAQLQHPGIVPVFASGTSERRQWFTMELVTGRRLDEYVRATNPSTAQRLALYEHIVEAVAHAHQNGVIHRDLKPSNVLVGDSGRPRLLDFGLAVGLEGVSKRVTESGEFLGTLRYSAPEQVAGGPTDTRTDVHALGVLLYELVAGASPWDDDDDTATLVRRILERTPRRPRGIDRATWAVLATALEKEPARRYATADAVLRDVRHLRLGEPLDTRRAGAFMALSAFIRRHRAAALLATVGLVVGGAAVVHSSREAAREARLREQADLARRVARELLERASPMTDPATRLALLEDVSRRLDAELGALGDVDASLALAVGEAHAARLAFDESEAPLRRAVERYHALGDAHGELRALDALAHTLAGRASPEAITVARAALQRTKQLFPADTVAEARSSRLVARALLAQDVVDEASVAEARTRLEVAIAAFGAHGAKPTAELAATWVLAAGIDDDHERARARCAAALDVLERTPGEAARTLDCLEAFSDLLFRADELTEADRMFARAVVLAEQTFGEAHTVHLLRARAVVAHRRGEYEASERLARTSLATELARWEGAKSVGDDTATAGALALELRGSGPPPYVAAFRLLRRLRGDGDFALSHWMNGIARLLGDRGRTGEAETLLRESLEIHCRLYGDDCPNRMRTYLQLARLLAASDRMSEARAALDEVLAATQRTLDPEHHAAAEARALAASWARTPVAPKPGGAR
jgi:predicted Ser/Thr protein kinase/tetratricopeptide (TPR) repeat protein